MNADNPPWDIHHQSHNPIDIAMPFRQGQTIFDFQQDEHIDKALTTHTSSDIPHLYHNDTTSHIPQNNVHYTNTQITMNPLESPTPITQQNTKSHNQDSPQYKHDTHNIVSNLQDSKLSDNTDSLSLQYQESTTLAIKYRPKTFSELIGQESVARTLSLALDSKKIANGYLFSGLRGSGKTSSARIFARCLQCETNISSTPCGICSNCKAALNGSHIDIIELDGASNRKIDDIRDVIEQTHYKPLIGRFKIFIIDEVHMLTKEAFNALLKTLEEPPHYVKFILATTDPLKVPPTILSRTQHFRFKKIPLSILKNHILTILQKEQVQADTESLNMIVRNGHGSVRDTLTLLDQAIIFCENNITSKKIADMLGSLDHKTFDSLFQALSDKNMQECIDFVKKLESYEIEMILDELSIYIKNKMLEEIPQISPILGMRYANIINDSKAMLQFDCDSEFCLLLTILKMFEAQKIKEITSVIQELETMENTNTAKNPPQLDTQYNITSTNSITSNAPTSTTSKHQTTPTNTFSPISQQIYSHNDKSNNSNNHTINQEKSDSDATQNNTTMLFKTFIQKIYERDYHIGNILENKVIFNGIDGDNLNLIFYTTEDETNALRHGYSGIISLARDVFGSNIRLKVDKQPADMLTANIAYDSSKQLAYQDSQNTIMTQNISHQQTHSNTFNNHNTTAVIQDSTQSTNTHEELYTNTQHDTSYHNKDSQNTTMQPTVLPHNDTITQQHAIDNIHHQTMEFIHNNKSLLKSMKNELGIQNVKVISLDDL